MIHKWKFKIGDKIINRSGEIETILVRWFDSCSNTGEWYQTKTLGISGSDWELVKNKYVSIFS